MKPLQRVIWSEGMLISPQHLQQLDRYHEALLEERVSTAIPYGVGVYALELDPSALDEGLVSVRSLQAVLPRGTVLALQPGHPELPKPRSIAEHFPATRESLGVYVAVQLETEGATAFAAGDDERGRYVSEHRAVTDLVEGTPLSVAFARRNVRLLFSEEDRAAAETTKIAELRRADTGGFALVEPYVPPCLRIGASPYLIREVQRILGLAVARQRSLSEERSQRDDTTVEYNAADITRFLLLNALNGSIPLLRHAAESGELSPHALYMMLIQLAGQLCSFAAQEDPLALPSYTHQQLRETFEPLFARLTSLLRVTLTGRHIRVALNAREDGLHLAKLKDEQLQREGVRFFVSVSAPLEEAVISAQVPRLTKVGSWTQITQLVSNAMPGAPVRFEPRPAKEIPIRPGQVYFSIDVTSSHWREVLRDRALAVHLPPPFDPKKVSVELLAIPAD